VANLRARHRCPVCLLVVTVDDGVARWAAKLIELGGGSLIVPWVVGPSNTPVVTDLAQAEADLELAVLSAKEHGPSADIQLAARVASVAILASAGAGIDAERFKMYLDLILSSLSEDARGALRAMNNLRGYVCVSDFARQNRAEGGADILLKLLTLRFGPLDAAIEQQVRGANIEQLDALAERVLTAQTLNEALAPQ
jgi:hypothetical protein